MSDLDRFMAKIHVEASGCWTWIAAKRYNGYGVFSVKAKPVPAHRWAYEHFVAPIPAGMTIDHVCHEKGVCNLGHDCPHRACVNPEHLTVATNAENVARGNAGHPSKPGPHTRAHRTRCKRGHLLDGDNLYIRPDGRRRCRTCQRMHWQAYAKTDQGRATIRRKEARRQTRG